MQKKIFEKQSIWLPGDVNKQVPCYPIAMTAKDANCRAGSFAFEGVNAATEVVGVSENATAENIVGVIKRAPYLTYNGAYNDIYPNGAELTVVTRGSVTVRINNTNAKYKDKVFVNPKTGEVQTGTGNAPDGFIDTGWKVSIVKDCANIIEISNIRFNY